MKEIMKYSILDNTVIQWGITLIIIAFAFLIKHTLSQYLAKLIARIFHKSKYQTYNQYLIKKVVKPLENLIFWSITLFAFDKLTYPSVLNIDILRGFSLHDLLRTLSSAWIIICFFYLLIGINYFISYVFKQNSSKIDNRSASQAISLLSDIISVVLILIAVFILLKVCFNYNVNSLLTSLGLVTAALALAAKETVENMICSFIILFDKPFLVGDFIKVNNISGNVEKIGIRSTHIRTTDKTLISVPNKTIVGGALENTSDQTRRRFNMTMELDINSSKEKMQQFLQKIREILKMEQNIIQDDSISVYFTETGTKSNKIFIEYFTWMNISFAQFRALNERINLEIIAIAKIIDISFNKDFDVSQVQ